LLGPHGGAGGGGGGAIISRRNFISHPWQLRQQQART
jgi:hypothetical protein